MNYDTLFIRLETFWEERDRPSIVIAIICCHIKGKFQFVFSIPFLHREHWVCELLGNPCLTKNLFWFYYQYKELYEMSIFIYALEVLVVYNFK